jgi:hypothetical protein
MPQKPRPGARSREGSELGLWLRCHVRWVYDSTPARGPGGVGGQPEGPEVKNIDFWVRTLFHVPPSVMLSTPEFYIYVVSGYFHENTLKTHETDPERGVPPRSLCQTFGVRRSKIIDFWVRGLRKQVV